MTTKERKEPILNMEPVRGQAPTVDEAAHQVVENLIASDAESKQLADMIKSTPLAGQDSMAYKLAQKQYNELYETLFSFTKEQMQSADKVPAPEDTLEKVSYNTALEDATNAKPAASKEELEQEARYRMISAQRAFQNMAMNTPTFGERFRSGMVSVTNGMKAASSAKARLMDRMEPSDKAKVQAKKGFLSSFKGLKDKMKGRVSQVANVVSESMFKMDMAARNILGKLSPVRRAMPIVTLGVGTAAILASSLPSLQGLHGLVTHFNHLGSHGFDGLGGLGPDPVFTNVADANMNGILHNAGTKLAGLSPDASTHALSNDVTAQAFNDITEKLGLSSSQKTPFLELAKLNEQDHTLDVALSQMTPEQVPGFDHAHLAAATMPEPTVAAAIPSHPDVSHVASHAAPHHTVVHGHGHAHVTTESLNEDSFEKGKVEAALDHHEKPLSPEEVSKAWSQKHLPEHQAVHEAVAAPTHPVATATPHEHTAHVASGADITDVAPKPGVVHQASLPAPETSDAQVRTLSHMTQESHGVTGHAQVHAADGRNYDVTGQTVTDPNAQNQQRLSSKVQSGIEYADRKTGQAIDTVSDTLTNVGHSIGRAFGL